MAEKTVSIKELKALAKEMNNVMGLDPLIDLTLDVESLEEQVRGESKEVYPTDEFSDTSKDTLSALGIGPWLATEEEEPAPEEKPEPAAAPREGDEEPPNGGEPKPEAPKKGGKKTVAKKKAAKKKTVAKKKAAPAKKAAPKKVEDVSPLGGHRPGSQGAKMDAALLAGGTVEQVAKKAGVTASRIHGHIQFLKKNRKVSVKVDDKTGKVKVKK